MLSANMLTYAFFLVLLGLGVVASDNLRNEELKIDLNKMQRQADSITQARNVNFVAEFFMTHFHHWGVYMTQFSTNMYEVAREAMFHLQDIISSFPFTAVETFSMTSICLLFYGVITILQRLERQNGRVVALEKENASLKESNKMNRVILNEVMAESKKPAMDDLNDAIKAIQEKEQMFVQYSCSVQQIAQNMRSEMTTLHLRLEEMENKYQELSLHLTSADKSGNNSSVINSEAVSNQSSAANETIKYQNHENGLNSAPGTGTQELDQQPHQDWQEVNKQSQVQELCQYDTSSQEAQQYDDLSGSYNTAETSQEPEVSAGHNDDSTTACSTTTPEDTTQQEFQISQREITLKINQLVYSCNASYLRTEKLQKANATLFRFVDEQFKIIFTELGHLARSHKRITDIVHCRYGSDV